MTHAEVKDLVDWYANQPRVRTLGLARDLIVAVGRGLSYRIDLANEIQEEYPGRFEIHMLGGSAQWPREVAAIKKYAPFVRSIDTSLPFNYALGNIPLADKVQPVKRPSNYFTGFGPALRSESLVEANIKTYLSWAE